jgi:hypothetical protein
MVVSWLVGWFDSWLVCQSKASQHIDGLQSVFAVSRLFTDAMVVTIRAEHATVTRKRSDRDATPGTRIKNQSGVERYIKRFHIIAVRTSQVGAGNGCLIHDDWVGSLVVGLMAPPTYPTNNPSN